MSRNVFELFHVIKNNISLLYFMLCKHRIFYSICFYSSILCNKYLNWYYIHICYRHRCGQMITSIPKDKCIKVMCLFSCNNVSSTTYTNNGILCILSLFLVASSRSNKHHCCFLYQLDQIHNMNEL